MDTLLAALQTVLRTLRGVAAKLLPGDAKSNLMTLTDMMVPFNALAKPLGMPQHGYYDGPTYILQCRLVPVT